MSSNEVIETIYGKYYKFEIIKKPGGVFSSPSFSVYKGGKPFKGPYSSLADAVQAAKDQG